MSSTSNVQNLLVNVVRPTYKWEAGTGFVPSVVVSNVTELIAGKVKTSALVVSDSNVNTYIGAEAGNGATNTLSNVGIGYSAMAGAVNADSNVAIGAFALAGVTNSDSNVAIGTGTDITGTGNRNILIGTNVLMANGSNNILIGVDVSRGTISNQLQIGPLLYGDISQGYIGINNPNPTSALDISGTVIFRNKVGVQNVAPVYSLDVNGSVRATDRFIGGLGSLAEPIYSFSNSSNSGMYVPPEDTSLGSTLTAGAGAFGIVVNNQNAAIFASNRVQFFQNLDVSGTFSASNFAITSAAIVDGSVNQPSLNFQNDASLGLFRAGAGILGVASGGIRRMAVLSNGDVSMGRLLSADISSSGVIFSSSGSNNIGGVTLSNGYVITTGTTSSSNLLVPGFLRDTDPATTLDISGGNISNSGTTRSSNFRGSDGSVSVPTYSFTSDPSTGIHWAGTSQLAFDTAGVQRMVVSNGNVGIGTATPSVALEVVGDVSATTYNGPGGTQSAPHFTFSDDRTTGIFFPGANMVGFTAGGTERMRISNSAIGIGTTAPTNALDVSGTLRVVGAAGDITLTNGAISIAGTPVISSTGVLSNSAGTSNSIGGVTLESSNVIASAFESSAGTSNLIGGVLFSNSNIYMDNGLVGTPSLTFKDETNTGLYRGAPNSLGVAVLGTETVNFSNNLIEFKPGGTDALWLSNGQTRLTTGSPGTPSLVFGVNTTTGLYSPIADVLAVSVTGTNAMTMASNYIDLNPNGMLALRLCNTQAQLTSGTAGTPSLAFAQDASTGFYRFNEGAGIVRYATQGLDRVTFSNDRVGIGTMAPESILDISFQSRPGLLVRNCGMTLSNTPGYGTLKIRGGAYNDIYIEDGNVNPSSLTESSGFTGWIFGTSSNVFGTNSRFGFYRVVAGAEVAGFRPFTIDASSGYVGIGTATPLGTLDVYTGTIVVNRLGNITNLTDVSAIVEGSQNVGMYWQKGNNNNYCGVSFKTLSNGTLAERLRIDANTGRVDLSGRTLIVCDGSTSSSAWGLNNQTDTLILQHTGSYSDVNSLGKSASILFANATLNYPQARIASEMLAVTPGGFASSLVFQTGNGAALAERMRIHTNGYIGIGTSNPTSRLEMYDSTGGTLALRVGTAIKTGGSNIIEFQGTDLGTPIPLSRITGVDTGAGLSPYRGDLVFGTANGLTVSERMRVRYDGYVGIGTTTPRSPLDISGNGSAIRIAGTDTNTGLLIQGYSNSGYLRTQNGPLYVGANGYGSVLMLNWTGTGDQVRVGIANTSPSHHLDVAGIIRGSSNIVATAVASNWINSWTSITDTTLTITYTPKQSGTVTILIEAGVDVTTGTGTGTDGARILIKNGGDILSEQRYAYDQQSVAGRGSGENIFGGGHFAVTTASGASAIVLNIIRVGDDTCAIRNGYLIVRELSTI